MPLKLLCQIVINNIEKVPYLPYYSFVFTTINSRYLFLTDSTISELLIIYDLLNCHYLQFGKRSFEIPFPEGRGKRKQLQSLSFRIFGEYITIPSRPYKFNAQSLNFVLFLLISQITNDFGLFQINLRSTNVSYLEKYIWLLYLLYSFFQILSSFFQFFHLLLPVICTTSSCPFTLSTLFLLRG